MSEGCRFRTKKHWLEELKAMIKKIDHIGIVVKSAEELVEVFSRLFGFQVTESLTFPEQGFKSTLYLPGR